MQNALRGLRDTLPKQGQNNTLNNVMRQYGGVEGAGGVAIGSLNAGQPQQRNALIVGSTRPQGGGRDPAPGMTSQEAANAAQVSNAENAPEVAGSVMGLAGGPMGKAMAVGAQGLTSAMKNALGPYGVTGLGKAGLAPQVGTPAFAQSTPAQDTAPGMPDAGAMAAARNNQNLSPQAMFGNMAAPTPNMQNGVPGIGDVANGVMDAIGLADAFEAENQDVFGGVASNVGQGNMRGSGRGGDPSAGTDDGRGPGQGGTTAGPSGVGRGNARGGGIGF